MNLEIDLKRLIWHEIGHLCVDVLMIEEFVDYHVEKIWFTYHSQATSEFKWEGAVQILPTTKFDVIVEDINKLSWALLNLVSGCVFQTISLKRSRDYNFENCFGLKRSCSGKGDFYNFFEINRKYFLKFGYRKEHRIFLEIELPSLWLDMVSSNIKFLNAVDLLVEREFKIICKLLDRYDDEESFSYIFEGDYLKTLVKEIRTIMFDTKFDKTLIKTRKILITKIEEDLKLVQIR